MIIGIAAWYYFRDTLCLKGGEKGGMETALAFVSYLAYMPACSTGIYASLFKIKWLFVITQNNKLHHMPRGWEYKSVPK